MHQTPFGGATHVSVSILSDPENVFVSKVLPKIPRGVETYHLTSLTILWSGLIIVFSGLARSSLHWLWGVSLMIAMQYLTDVLDGKIGKLRNTGLVKWGFYMDHFLDYLFLSSIIIGYSLIAPPGLAFYFLALLTLLGALLVHSYLAFAATNQLRVHFFRFGPTEARVLFILVNTILVFTGTQHFVVSVPATVVVGLLVVAALVFRMQRTLWRLDMEAKRLNSHGQ
ncbi:MAG: CDP-alcohol phosphatidyltransferase family protein [Candidatus Latescibacteria bacterium]|nr:CDP-alcohol phosphatidyltransferase family protein [Candidatus Latescibacterota bacterium]